MDAHDGQIAQFDGTYYLYGTSYDCGFRWLVNSDFCGFKVYSSPDLVHWTDRGYLFNGQTGYWREQCSTGCFRPHVIYDHVRHEYVLWFNGAGTSSYVVMTSSTPTGPFTNATSPQLAIAGAHGDENLFVDSDGTGYVVYTTASFDLIVEKLNSSYTSGTGEYASVHTSFVEAPAMFKRKGLYYVTFSNPSCPFCSATGTAYLTATSPLGPWTGRSEWTRSNGQLRAGGSYYTGQPPVFSTPTSATGIGLSKAGAGWTNYKFSFDTVPGTGSMFGYGYAYSGWVFRSSGPQNGYVWALSNYPYTSPAAPGYLVKSTFKDGSLVSQQPVPLNLPVTAGHRYRVETTVSGEAITTAVNGQTVDRTVDATFSQGRVGFQETASSSALVDNVNVTAPDGSTLLSDDFSDGLAQWDPLTGPLTITPTSCGGQPSFVTQIPQRGGSPVYIYGSDLWDGHFNEALANYLWAPLRFGWDGAIQPLQCAPTVPVNLAAGKPGQQAPIPGLDQSSGVSGFTTTCDVSAGTQRMQTFTVGRTGTLEQIRFTAYQGTTPAGLAPWPGAKGPGSEVTGPLVLQLVTLNPQGAIKQILAEHTFDTDEVGWSPRDLVMTPDVPVTHGTSYAIIASSTTTQGCYGVATSGANPYAGGHSAISTDGGVTFTAQRSTDLKFLTVVGT